MTNDTQHKHHSGHRQRLKKRFLHHGLEPFQDYEILELLLTYAIHQKDVKPIAKRLLQRFATIQSVMDAPVEDLTAVEGVGEHTALLLKLTQACSSVYLKQIMLAKDVLSSPDDLINYCRASMGHLQDEQFRVIFLNARNEVISDLVAQQGTVDQTAVYPRNIMEQALKVKAVAMIVAHNHPSGHPEPSSHDRQLTATLVRSAEPLGITIHDHVIIGKSTYFSFRQEGLM